MGDFLEAGNISAEATVRKTKNKKLKTKIKNYWPLYALALPGIVYFIIFRYVPLAGSVIAFQDYNIFGGITESPWVGFKHFEAFFAGDNFKRVFINTMIIGAYNVIFVFPLPVILAILFNEIRLMLYKRFMQTIYYVPHFFSWVIIGGLTFEVLSADGFVNTIRAWFDLEPILFMQNAEYFRGIVVLTSAYRDVGWGTIILLAAISSIDPEVYEAAVVDGANRFRQILSITLPMLMPTVIVLFLLNIGNFLDLGFEQIYNLLTPMTMSTGDVIDTYVFRVGILQAQYSSTTAIGMFQSVIGFILVVGLNQLAKKFKEDGGIF